MEITEIIKQSIISYFGVDFDNRSRERRYYYPRALYFTLCRELTNLSLNEIARTLDNVLDHASIINAISKFKDTIMPVEPEYRKFYSAFEVVKYPTVKSVDLLKGRITI